MSLIDLANNSRTDKNTRHSYLPLYEKILHPIKNTAKNIMEIGILDGGSIKLWHDYFIHANVYGVDIMEIDNVWNEIKNNDKIILYTSTDAYNEKFVDESFVKKDIQFDMILDDGPHTLDSMKFCIQHYSPLLNENGILIIEDVQSYDWIESLKAVVPEHLKNFIQVYDLRANKNRYDDILFVINKHNY